MLQVKQHAATGAAEEETGNTCCYGDSYVCGGGGCDSNPDSYCNAGKETCESPQAQGGCWGPTGARPHWVHCPAALQQVEAVQHAEETVQEDGNTCCYGDSYVCGGGGCDSNPDS